MKKIIYLSCIILTAITGLPTLAATPNNFKEVINNVIIGGLLRPLIPLLIGLAVVVFIYGVFLLMINDGGEKKEEGKQYMLWGIIGIFIMVSVWGLVAIVSNTFDLNNTPQTIQINTSGLNVNSYGGSVASPANNFNARDSSGNVIYRYYPN